MGMRLHPTDEPLKVQEDAEKRTVISYLSPYPPAPERDTGQRTLDALVPSRARLSLKQSMFSARDEDDRTTLMVS